MKFYSGFSLKNEENEQELFSEYLIKNEFAVGGFSYGAIKAFEYVLNSKNRVDTLQLFSPAFFQNRDKTFKRLQLISYKKDKDSYMKQFIKSCFSPYEPKIIQHRETNIDELKELLEYVWSYDKLQVLKRAGVNIEIYLGGNDKIIDALQSKEFFLKIATVTYIKNANHFLQID